MDLSATPRIGDWYSGAASSARRRARAGAAAAADAQVPVEVTRAIAWHNRL